MVQLHEQPAHMSKALLQEQVLSLLPLSNQVHLALHRGSQLRFRQVVPRRLRKSLIPFDYRQPQRGRTEAVVAAV